VTPKIDAKAQCDVRDTVDLTGDVLHLTLVLGRVLGNNIRLHHPVNRELPKG